MKTVTVREFYHCAALVDGLGEGKQLVVTSNGKPKFVVTKGVRPRITRELAEQRAIPSGTGQIDITSFLKSRKQ